MRTSSKYIPVSLVLLAVSFLAMLTGIAHASEKGYDRLASLSSEELYKRGIACHENSRDSAMLYYSLVDSRYNSRMSDEETKLCINALIKKWRISFYDYYDYARAFECLSRAQEIAEEKELVMPTLDLQLGILYQVISEQTGDLKSAEIAYDYYRNGLENAVAINDTAWVDVLASNFVQHSFYIDKLDSIKTSWDSYVAKRGSTGREVYRYNVKMYEGLRLLKNRDYGRSLNLFDSLYRDTSSIPNGVRYNLIAACNEALVMKEMGAYNEAVALLQVPLQITESIHMKDGQIEIYEALSEYYRALGNEMVAMKYENKSLKLKDSLINYSQLSRLEEVKSGRNLRKYQERLAVIEAERKMQRVVTIVIAVFLVVVCALLVVLFNRNRRLKESNKVLYDKNIDILRQSEKELETRKEYERRLEEMAARESMLQQSEKASEKQDSIGKEEKYKGSRLDEADKTELLNDVIGVMNSIDEYLKPDFSIERLAELAGSKSKLVSQVINERQGCNFNSFVNEYRIREACRRISDIDRYGKLTLDAISKSVGFRARSSFFTAFKAVTGLTPSEFQKIARAEHK